MCIGKSSAAKLHREGIEWEKFSHFLFSLSLEVLWNHFSRQRLNHASKESFLRVDPSSRVSFSLSLPPVGSEVLIVELLTCRIRYVLLNFNSLSVTFFLCRCNCATAPSTARFLQCFRTGITSSFLIQGSKTVAREIRPTHQENLEFPRTVSA